MHRPNGRTSSNGWGLLSDPDRALGIGAPTQSTLSRPDGHTRKDRPLSLSKPHG